jgi:hypothetical protein
VVVCVMGFDPWCGPARPSLAWSGPRAPGAPLPSPCARPCPPHARAPPPPGLFLSFDFSRAVTSLSLFHLSLSPWFPRVWRRDRQSLDPRGERPLPSPPLPYPSLSPLPFFFPWPRALPLTRALPCSRTRPGRVPALAACPPGRAPSRALCPLPGGPPRRAPSLPWRAPSPARALPCPGEPSPSQPLRGEPRPRRAPPLPGGPPRRDPASSRPAPPQRAPPCASPRTGGRAPVATPRSRPRPPLPEPVPWQLRAPRACTVCVPSARAACSRACDVVALRSTLVLIHFNFSLVDVLRRALHRATVHSKFVFINVCVARFVVRRFFLNLYLLRCCVVRFVARRFV